MKTVLILILRFYRLAISPYLGNNCRFHPTCSVYAMQALEKYGALKGSWLAIKRIAKCHPGHPGGIDEIP
ncbi:MAG: membrane protein insertion efficiency factor YidD [Ignavibacteria bacterium]|nr:membrane protein insertion efficiency factor YidD [Ignavibacteria bacterium]